MNLLMVTAGLPRPIGGANTRNFHLLKALSQEYRVSLLVLANDDEIDQVDLLSSMNEFAYSIQLIRYELPDRFKRLIQILHAVRGKSYFLNLFIIPEMQYALNAICTHRHFDIVLFESVLVAGYHLPHGLKFVIDQHNIEHELLERTYEHEKALLRKWYSWHESRLLKLGEIERCRKADVVLVTSEREYGVLKHLIPGQQIEVIPNGVDITTFVQHDSGQEIAHRIIFTGSMDYYPNIDAVLFFARECWSFIKAQVPSASWQIVGKAPPREVRDLAELPGITVTGTVPEVTPYLASAAVAIAPLQIGSGTRLKILEALAMRKAVVSTSLGCEGLSVTSGMHLIVADRAQAFAGAVIDLMQDTEKRKALGDAGRILVETEYSWESCGNQLLHVLETRFEEREEYASTTGA
jgi:sugar transferase (PEP-CTERM/EpsH1 system associated)